MAHSGGGANGPNFKNIGLWFTGEKNVLLGMHVNVVYNIFDAQQQEETKRLKSIFLNFLRLKKQRKKYMSFEPSYRD